VLEAGPPVRPHRDQIEVVAPSELDDLDRRRPLEQEGIYPAHAQVLHVPLGGF
jgi:hypothetical protein